jgi:hypothetical protein
MGTRHSIRSVLGVVALIAATALPSASAIAESARGKALQPSGSAPTVTAAEREGSPSAASRPRRSHERLVPDRAALRRAKEKAAARYAAAGEAAASVTPSAAVFNGLNKPGISATNSSPPDTTGAIGPNSYIEMVNGQVRIYNRDLTTVKATADLDDFILSPGDSVFDPQIQWDEQANRFFFVMDDVVDIATNSWLAFGWSKTANPTNLSTNWCVKFTRNLGTEFEDYPKLGHNNNHIIFGTNVFGVSGFLTSRIWAVPKPANADTSCDFNPTAYFFGGGINPALATLDGDVAFTPVPANTYGSSANGYVVAADFMTGDSEIMVWHVSGNKTDPPTLTPDANIAVGTYAVPANVPQPDNSYLLDSSDSRLTQAVAAVDPAVGKLAIWTQHTVAGAGGRAVVRWYELVPTATTKKRQEGTIANASHFVFNAAISPTAGGNAAVINYNLGSASLRPQIRAQSRAGATALGTMGGEIVLGSSSTSNQDFTCSPCRWGDYAGASPDPNDNTLVWGSNQAIGPFSSDPHWITRNFAIKATAPIANDNLAKPKSIGSSLPFNASVNVASATTEASEKLKCAASFDHTVWYSYKTGTAGTTVRVTTANSGFDTVLAVYKKTGSGFGGLVLAACNDDAQGASNVTSVVQFKPAAGATYLIQAGGFGSAKGTLKLHVTKL